MEAHAKKIKETITSFSFLQENGDLTKPLFSSSFFHYLIIENLYVCPPMLRVLIDMKHLHLTMDNIFALGMTAILALMQDYQEGTCQL